MNKSRNMNIGHRALLPFVIVALALPVTAWAESFPHRSVDAMCDNVEAIIEGTWLGENDVRIDKVHKASTLLAIDSTAIEVSRLNLHSRVIGDGDIFSLEKTRLETRKLILFLVREKETGKWESIFTINADGGCGSCGLFWFDDSTCYGYRQTMNPGPYVLMSAEDSRNLSHPIPHTVQGFRKEIEIGLANSREWRRSLAIEAPVERAKSLGRYLLKSSSPEGDKGTYRETVRQPLAALGKDAVPVLVQVLRTAPADERLDTAVLSLLDIGPPAAEAIPELHALLKQPDRAYPQYVLEALVTTGDPRAIPVLEEYLKSDKGYLPGVAREAIAKIRERQTQVLERLDR